MFKQVLHLDAAGFPMGWLSLEEAATQYAKDNVLWELGDIARTLHGGFSNMGIRSELELRPIIASKEVLGAKKMRGVGLCNTTLFERDQYLCLYCGEKFGKALLTRDHVVPKSKGGANTWENCVSACRGCNSHKADRTPEQAGMKLLAVPFKPNPYEAILLKGRNIIADQMEYLSKGLSKNRDWKLAS